MVIIDVREPAEFAHGHVEGALNIPLGTLAASGVPGDVSKDEQVVLYCNSGNRSEQATLLLKSKGYPNATNGKNQQVVESNYR